jgi:hypothetical protein
MRPLISASVVVLVVVASARADDAPSALRDAVHATESAPPSRVPASPLDSPPFPNGDWPGPTIGEPISTPDFALMKAMTGTRLGTWLSDHRIFTYGWIDVGANWSTSKHSNSPAGYDLVASNAGLNQAVLRIERPLDTAQTDHVDWGFRVTNLFGTDYRYGAAKGFLDSALLDRNKLYAYDCPELYAQWYLPKIAEGATLTVGRYYSDPDIEGQLATSNYMRSHSQMLVVDPTTFFGALAAVRMNPNWTIELGAHGGSDMAPWTSSSSLNGHAMVRWVADGNDDSVWAGANSIGNGEFRDEHDNLQHLVATWGHRFSADVHTMTEAYYMWQRDALRGGTVSDGPVRNFGGGGGPGVEINGRSDAFGFVNFVAVKLSKADYLTIRNGFLDDWQGQRTGVRNRYSDHAVGVSHNFSDAVTIRPELSYARAYDDKAFDLGTSKNQFAFIVDLIVRF